MVAMLGRLESLEEQVAALSPALEVLRAPALDMKDYSLPRASMLS